MDNQEIRRRPGSKLRGKRDEGKYANYFQIGHNAAEFLFEFGQQDGGIHTRVYVSPQHARILSDLLLKTLQLHEKTFGLLTNPRTEGSG